MAATQGYTNPLLDKIILMLLEEGYSAEDVLREALTRYPKSKYRQVSIPFQDIVWQHIQVNGP